MVGIGSGRGTFKISLQSASSLCVKVGCQYVSRMASCKGACLQRWGAVIDMNVDVLSTWGLRVSSLVLG